MPHVGGCGTEPFRKASVQLVAFGDLVAPGRQRDRLAVELDLEVGDRDQHLAAPCWLLAQVSAERLADLCGAGPVRFSRLLVEAPGEVRVDPCVDVAALLGFRSHDSEGSAGPRDDLQR
jgi:hypothetical protein